MDTIDTGAEDPSKLEAARKEAEKTKNLQTLFKGTKKPFFWKNHKIVLTYCKKKNVLVIEKNFWNSRLKAKNLQIFWDH